MPNHKRIDSVLDELALLQQNFIQKAGELLEAVEDDISLSSHYLESLNVSPSDASEMSALTGGSFLLPSLMSPKRKFMNSLKYATVNAVDANQLRLNIRSLGAAANYKINREFR